MIKDAYYFDFDPEKNVLLQRERGISFEQMIVLIEMGNLLDIRSHHNPKKYPNQHIIEIEDGEEIYLVPCVIEKNKIFLKTIYPSRKARKVHKKGKFHD